MSDHFGRRPVLLVSLFIMCIDYLVMAIATSVWMLLIARLVAGITAATQSTATAFIADISTPEEKAKRFGMVGAAFGIGIVLGPVLGGVLAKWGTSAPFLAAAALSGMNLAFGLFVLPETVTDKVRRPLKWTRANPVGALKQLSKLPHVSRLLLLFFLYEFAFMVYPAIWAYFSKARFDWSPSMIGLSLGAFGISLAVVQGGLVGTVIKHLGERRTILYGICFNGFAFLFLSIVWSGWVALAFIPLTAIGAVVTPTLQGQMSTLAAGDQQGELQGVIGSSRSLAAIFSPLLMTQIFWLATPSTGFSLPGAPFLLSCVLMGVCAFVFARARPVAP